MKHLIASSAIGLGLILGSASMANAQSCEITVGSVLSITGSMAAIGSAIGDAGRLAVDQFNEAGGVNGCTLKYVLRDDQGSPNVGVDAAKMLVEIERAPVLLGAIQSGVSLPILTSVTVPANVTQISCCSSAPSFTALAKEGGTKGFWFRTLPTDRPQAAVLAKIAAERGYKKLAIVHVNSDYGTSLAGSFKRDAEKFGITVTNMVAYNQEQASYRAETARQQTTYNQPAYTSFYLASDLDWAKVPVLTAPVTPAAPKFKDRPGTAHDEVQVPKNVDGVTYYVNGEEVTSKNAKVRVTGEATVVAVPDAWYRIADDATSQWTEEFSTR